MNRKIYFNKMVFLLLILLITNVGYAKDWYTSVFVGPSKPYGAYDYWNEGIYTGTTFLYSVTEKILIGGHFVYNHWNYPREYRKIYTGEMKLYSESELYSDYEASQTIGEIGARVRYIIGTIFNNSSDESKGTNFFGQLDVSWFEAHFKSEGSDKVIEIENNRVDSNFGFSLGAGLSFGILKTGRAEVVPLFHVIIDENTSYRSFFKYFSLNFGILF